MDDERLKVGDLVRNTFVPALIGKVVESRADGIIKVKIEGKPAVMDISKCWERIKEG